MNSDDGAAAEISEAAGELAAGQKEECSATEQVLIDIWKNVLKLPSIGLDDNFFDLGGHSLLASQIVSKARSRLGKRIRLNQVFAYPTIAQLAEEVDRD